MQPTTLRHEFLKAKLENKFDALVVTYYHTELDVWKPLSFFNDIKWILPLELFPKGTSSHERTLNFSKTPKNFCNIFKMSLLELIINSKRQGKRSSGKSIISFFYNCSQFIKYSSIFYTSLSSITPFLMHNYASMVDSAENRNKKPISSQTKYSKLRAVEQLYDLTIETSDPLRRPWPETSAGELSGRTLSQSTVKTSVIPEQILGQLFQLSDEYLKKSKILLAIKNTHRAALIVNSRSKAQKIAAELAAPNGWRDMRDINREIDNALSACMIIILTTTGIRSNEMLSLETGCLEVRDGDDGKIYYIHGVADGKKRSWVATQLTHEAIQVAAEITSSARQRILSELSSPSRLSTTANINNELHRHKNSIFLQYTSDTASPTMNNACINYRLKKFCQLAGLNWNIASHQFRPTFARYAAQSMHGDLRYLRVHFGHWNIDMSASYAGQDLVDSDLLEEIYSAWNDIKREFAETVLNPATPLTGGLAKNVKAFRESITTYSNRAKMVSLVADRFFLRATSVGWCANDQGNCLGGNGPERTRCASNKGCAHFLADKTHIDVWAGIYDQQRELIELKDISEPMKIRILRDMDRAEHVLKDLGYEF